MDLKNMARPAGFEPATYGLEDSRSEFCNLLIPHKLLKLLVLDLRQIWAISAILGNFVDFFTTNSRRFFYRFSGRSALEKAENQSLFSQIINRPQERIR